MNNDTLDMPDELQGRPKAAPMDPGLKAERLAALGVLIAGKRDAAIKARKESGIEDVWLACEDAYQAIDDANRAEFAKARWAKSTSMQGPLTTNTSKQSDSKSNAYPRLTTRYVDMGAAKISEIVLPIDDKAFSFSETPVPDLIKAKDDTTPATTKDGQHIWRPAKPEEMGGVIQGDPAAAAQGAQAGAQPQVRVTKGDVAQALLQQARDAAKKAETRIYDWMVESRYPKQMRKVLHDSSRLGVGVLKGPFPDLRKSKAWVDGKVVMKTRIAPACKWIDPWNFFPHGGCGEDVHSGEHVFERDFLATPGLKALKKLTIADEKGSKRPIYLSAQIDKVIAEGPGKVNLEARNPNQPDNEKQGRFELWYFTGTLTKEDMQVLDAPGVDELPDELSECFCLVTLVNDSVIGATFNPLSESGSFGYRTFPWSRRAGHWAGVGVAEQVNLPQRIVTAATRALLNNAGKSAGAQIVMDPSQLIPADGSWDLGVGDKLWHKSGDAVTDDIRKIFMSVEFPNLGDKLMRVIEYGFKLAEEASNIPLISQGQTGPQDPQTFGQAELQNNNANTLLRDKAYSLDDHITEPLVDDFYEWLLLDADVPADEKGDFKINAKGSSAMVEKAIQQQVMAQLLPLSLNPVWGQNPKKLMSEYLKGNRMNPGATEYTEEELAQMQSQPPPKAPAVEVAEIRAKVDLHRQDMSDKTKKEIAAQDTDRDTAYNNSLAQRDEIARQAAREKHQMDMDLEMLRYANMRQISIEDAKKDMAALAMKLTTQVELSRDAHAVDIHKHSIEQVSTPPTEPAGRAAPGQAYEQ